MPQPYANNTATTHGLSRLRHWKNLKSPLPLFLENGGWGAYAAPLAREMTDFYMLHVKPQQFSDGLETDLTQTEKN